MLSDVFWLSGGLVALFLGAHYFVEGAIALSHRFGFSSLWVGIVIVGFITTLPEILFTTLSLWQDHYGLALGNPIGSYIANIGLVLGLSACYRPIRVKRRLFRFELPWLAAVVVLVWLLLTDGVLSRLDGAVLFVSMLLFLFFLSQQMKKRAKDSVLLSAALSKKTMEKSFAGLRLLAGFIVLWLGAEAMIKGSVGIAQAFGVSDLVIGLSIVAIGTSLPELAASVASLKKDEHDLAMGNVIGSNILCLLGVLALPGLWGDHAIEQVMLWRDMPMVMLMTVALWWFAYGGRKEDGWFVISRFEGASLVVLFSGYLCAVATGAI